MKQRTYPQVWRDLSADEKQDLASRSETTYGYLKVIACKNGACGRHLADAITLALIEMGQIEGEVKDLRSVMFPDIKAPQNHQASSVELSA